MVPNAATAAAAAAACVNCSIVVGNDAEQQLCDGIMVALVSVDRLPDIPK